jgi:threonine/homoserine/homoserine lactone efflux protein
MFIDNFWQLTGILILAVLSPGPSFVGVTRYFLRYGFQKTLAFNAGIAFGEGMLSAIVLLGLSSFLLDHFWFNVCFYALSGFYLSYIGFQMIKAEKFKMEEKPISKKIKGFWSGISIGASNPKSMVFDAALFSNFITADTSLIQKFSTWIWVMFVTFSCFTFLCLAFSAYRDKLLSKLIYVERICGTALLFLGIQLLYKTILLF